EDGGEVDVVVEREDPGPPERVVALGADAERQGPGYRRGPSSGHRRQLYDDAVVVGGEGRHRVLHLVGDRLRGDDAARCRTGVVQPGIRGARQRAAQATVFVEQANAQDAVRVQIAQRLFRGALAGAAARDRRKLVEADDLDRNPARGFSGDFDIRAL